MTRRGPRSAAPALLLELPHGATRGADFSRLAGRLSSRLPSDLDAFFHVNTDEGAPELALRIAELVGSEWRPRWPVLVIRSLLPRTLVDCNRVVDRAAADGMTPGIPPYVTAAADRALLRDLHRRYNGVVEAAYAAVCGNGGLAIALHTYSPRSVDVEVDDRVVAALRRAYAPGIYERWPLRPPVDLLTAGSDGVDLAPEGLAEAIAAELEAIGIEARRNATYRLHPATQGYRHAARWPGRTLAIEVRRDLLGAPFRPFEESAIGPENVERLAVPLAKAIARALAP